MKLIGVLLILGSIGGFGLSTVAFGDIGLSFAYAAGVSLLTGIGFLITSRHV